MRLEPAGPEALLLVLADQPDAGLPLRIAALADLIQLELGPLVVDLVPGWTTLLLHYDLLRTDHLQLSRRLLPLLEDWCVQAQPSRSGHLHEIPVWYAGEDLAEVARACALSEAELIALHSGVEYRVGAIGFAPGFAYLGELDARLSLPRRRTPRTRVPGGSLAIAERQTAIYPQTSPGGWHLIGRCPWRLFDAQAEPPCALAVGDRVRFLAIDEAAFRAEGGAP
ncbi:allophanate hydrolase subunit 1 [Azotobacter vinelandii CA]|uniref:Allophanate hydrolase subunit 1 n=2 Tax=Azotobacter vinelandii TaxID=354 RepID=C1DQ21_AZOVD|nr:5-oxoprolinase subunit PxpB [Azotobacter vinelandii]ACO77473.1 allophanate hydrolase subunit 1 [Azotobacter vinelandii DJ]AGK15364.1 allophanate hydrolase subunit 1 [Azotobacter vinelandii CA]AGK19819.1 allophanate hydrolase subunit 1 [Azotobacter vinelandii CA6]WKN23259.1 5-oxoprolinase subunit PxpB [Azotobacter vinelandii]SFX49349.1 sensor histidine kinase inhibitor, KipI family [Azotobacter vinelandii]